MMMNESKASELLDTEAEFLASKQETGNEWELFKENVRPLKRGRNVSLLNQALRSQADCQLKKSLLHHRRMLIQAIDDYDGDDPLHPWLDCIKWVQEAFPPGGDSSGLVVIYEQCVRAFWHDQRYKDDLRYLKVWLEYAEHCTDAEVIYSFLEANEIGLTHSSLYISYALHMEHKRKIKTANEIFSRGISAAAQPLVKLKEAYQKFLLRSMRQPKSTEEEDMTVPRCPARSFGTVLARGENRNQANESSDQARKKLKQDITPFSVYKDTTPGSRATIHDSDASKLDSRAWHSLGSRADRNKENNAVPSKWNHNKVPQRFAPRIGGVSGSSSIEIYVDEEIAESQKTENAGRSSGLQLREGENGDFKKETQLLRENPLRNFPPSSFPR